MIAAALMESILVMGLVLGWWVRTDRPRNKKAPVLEERGFSILRSDRRSKTRALAPVREDEWS